MADSLLKIITTTNLKAALPQLSSDNNLVKVASNLSNGANTIDYIRRDLYILVCFFAFQFLYIGIAGLIQSKKY